MKRYPKPPHPFHYLLGVDGSEEARDAFQVCLKLLCPGYRLTILTVGITFGEREKGIVQMYQELAKEHEVEALVEYVQVEGLGHAGTELCQAAERLHADFLVIGFACQESRAVGSTAKYAARHSHCHCVIVKRDSRDHITIPLPATHS
eukprot:Colp12_sorted_trinity150504_noHs@13605